MGALAEQGASDFLLVRFALQELVRGLAPLSDVLGVLDEDLRLQFHEREEVHALDPEAVIDEAVEVLVATEGEMAVKNDPVMATENGYNGRRESLDKAVHGVLLQWNVW